MGCLILVAVAFAGAVAFQLRRLSQVDRSSATEGSADFRSGALLDEVEPLLQVTKGLTRRPDVRRAAREAI